MEDVAKKLDFLSAADLRDKIELLKKEIKIKKVHISAPNFWIIITFS